MASYLDENGLSHLWAKIKLLVSNTYSPSNATPLMDGTASVGTSADFARGDHVHPTDTTRAAVSTTVTGVSFDSTNGFRQTINGTASSIVTVAALKTALGVVDTDFTGASSGSAGTHGLVPAPSAGQQNLYLRGDGLWATPSNTNTTYTLSGALSSHKFTNTLTPSSGTATTSDLTLAAGTRITLTDNTSTNTITIATSAEVNQNAFSNVAVSGQTTVAADSKTDTLTLAAGDNVTITTNATTDTVTIAATNTTYTAASASSAGLMSSADYSKLAAFDTADKYALKTDLSGLYKYKGSVATAAALPASPAEGDVYNIVAESTYGPAGTNVAWTGTEWDALGGLFTITSITNAEIDAICV